MLPSSFICFLIENKNFLESLNGTELAAERKEIIPISKTTYFFGGAAAVRVIQFSFIFFRLSIKFLLT